MTTPAQAAQQDNRDGAGRYATKPAGEASVDLAEPKRVYLAWIPDETTAYGNKTYTDLDHALFRPGTFLNVDVEGLKTNESVRVEYDDSDTLKVMAIMELDHEVGIRDALMRRDRIDPETFGDFDYGETYTELTDRADEWVAERGVAIENYVREWTAAHETDIAAPYGSRHVTYAWSTVIPRRGGLDDAVVTAEVIRGWNPVDNESFYDNMLEKLGF